jgi:hypothetical protein
MQFFYVTQDVTLRYGDKVLDLKAPPKELLEKKSLSLAHLRCGFIAWEAIKTKEAAGPNAAVILTEHPEILRFLPPKILSFSQGGNLNKQLQEIKSQRIEEKRSAPIRIALVNGFGTMLGDNLVGVSALEQAVQVYKENISEALEIHAFLAWNAIPGTEKVLSISPAITSVQAYSATLEQLRTFDAYWDFSALLSMSGYDSTNFYDFYLDHLGVDPNEVDQNKKVPSVQVTQGSLDEVLSEFHRRSINGPVIFLQCKASTDVRSMPQRISEKIFKVILEKTNATIVLAQIEPCVLNPRYHTRVHNFGDWTAGNLERYQSLIAASDVVVSVDTLALHIASALKKPAIGFFTVLEPSLRVKYAASTTSFLIPGAESLPYWGKHKSDSNWAPAEPLYEAAWGQMDLDQVVSQIQQHLAKS